MNLIKELGLTPEIAEILKAETPTEEQIQKIKDYAKEREDFFKAKYESEKVDKEALKKETYNEVLHVLRNAAKKYVENPDELKDLGHKEIIQKIAEVYDGRLKDVQGADEKLLAKIDKITKDNDSLREKLVNQNSEWEAKLNEEKTSFEKKLAETQNQIKSKQVYDIWTKAVTDKEIKLIADNVQMIDLIKLKAEQKGYLIDINDKGDAVIKQREGEEFRQAQTIDGKNFIKTPVDLVKEIAAAENFFAKSNGQEAAQTVNKAIVNGKTIDHSGSAALAQLMQ